MSNMYCYKPEENLRIFDQGMRLKIHSLGAMTWDTWCTTLVCEVPELN